MWQQQCTVALLLYGGLWPCMSGHIFSSTRAHDQDHRDDDENVGQAMQWGCRWYKIWGCNAMKWTDTYSQLTQILMSKFSQVGCWVALVCEEAYSQSSPTLRSASLLSLASQEIYHKIHCSALRWSTLHQNVLKELNLACWTALQCNWIQFNLARWTAFNSAIYHPAPLLLRTQVSAWELC